MTGKNNRNTHSKQVPHYGLRKLSVGVASVLLSTTIYLGASAGVAHASMDDVHGQESISQTVYENQPSGSSQPSDTDNVSPSDVPAATKNVNSVFNNSVVSNVHVQEFPGQIGSDKIADAGTTELSFDFELTANQASQLHAGDYIDIKMGITYTVTANGQTERLSYGRDVPQNTPVKFLSDDHKLIGYLVPVNDNNSYIATINSNQTNTDNVNWVSVQKNNLDAVSDLGATNGYYRLIFVDDINKLGAVSAKNRRINWYNAFANADSTKPALKTPSFTLYSPDSSIHSYSPKDDVLIGSTVATSGLSIAVAHVDPAVQLNTPDELKPNTSTRTAAHWWYQRQDGTFVLGYNSIADPSQSEGVSLTNEVGKDFDITVTKPDDNAKATYYFADDSQVKKDLERAIVGTTQTEVVDPIIGANNLSVGKQSIVHKPNVSVTSTINGNQKTYHIHIDRDYDGFKHDTNGNSSYASTITLMSWKPTDPTDLLPPANSGITDNNSDDPSAIEKIYHTQYVGGVLVNPDLIKVLEKNPWHVEITKNGQKVPLSGVGSNNVAGYYFMKNPQLLTNAPNNYGYGIGNYGKSNTVVTKQIIHYWSNKIGGKKVAPDTVRTISFTSKDDKTWYNSTNPEKDNYNKGAFYDVTVPKINGYTAYGDNNLTADDYADPKNATLPNAKEVTKIGFQGYYNPDNYRSQATYNKNENALVVNVVYRGVEQKINYQVVPENADGVTGKAIKGATLLATGKSDQEMTDQEKNKWKKLLREYSSYKLDGQEYIIVSSDSNDSKLHKTDVLPVKFDHDPSIDQLVTIYLAPKPNEQGIVTIHYMDEGVNPAKTQFEPRDGTELIDHQQSIQGTVGKSYSNNLWDYRQAGYELIKKDDNASSGTITKDHQDFYVYLKHIAKQITDSKDINEIIHYVYANGTHAGEPAAMDYTAQRILMRTKTVDQVNGSVTYGPWNTVEPFVEVKSPMIKDYTADLLAIPEIAVTENSGDIVKNVYYKMKTKPVTPNTPVTPDSPHDEPGTNTPKDNPGNDNPQPGTGVDHGHPESGNHHDIPQMSKGQAKLPQTGNTTAGLAILGLVAMMSALGLGLKRRKNN